MRRRIVIMPEELSCKIAAGEVVERPASIVKELVENSLDAAATDILVELENGGKKSIRITDNGEGMDRNDAALAFERYATSKIHEFEDIYDIRSFGFRGEALPSIASISKLEMLTKRKESISGTRISLEGGKFKEIIDAGCPVGTSMFVNDIFYSTPARQKFLKKDSTEQVHCIDAVTRLALAHPEVRIRVLANKREVLNLPKTEDLYERISFVLGDDFKKNTLPVEATDENVRLAGLISKPSFTRSNTKGIFCYVNGRFVRDSLLNNAVLTPYRRLIEAKRFPSAVIFIDLPPSDLDVNVHPAKMEVRFKNPWNIHKIIVNGLTSSLADAVHLSEVSAFYPSGNTKAGFEDYGKRVQESLKRYTILSGEGKPYFKDGTYDTIRFQSLFEESTLSKQTVIFSSLRYLCQIAGTYLIFSAPDGIVLMDQHAAHERVLFEKLKNVSYEKKFEKQVLLIPEIINLAPSDFTLLSDHFEFLNDICFEVEDYGGNSVLIKSVPAILSNIDLKTIIFDIVEEAVKTGGSTSIQEVEDKILTLLACKCAVKANHKLTEPEVESLCKDLDSIKFASTCPHGRPTYVKIGIQEMEKMFKRK